LILYRELVDGLQPPEEADIEHITMVAHELLSGQMEWAYGERTEDDVPLNRVAHAILEMIDKLQQLEQRRSISKRIASFRNVAKGGETVSTQQIEIPLEPDQGWTIDDYYDLAKQVYHDIPEPDNNVGGRLFLIETNMEVTHEIKDKYTFFNAKALHLEQVGELHALVNLARNGALVIEDVRIGG
jgi:hypothetical protein